MKTVVAALIEKDGKYLIARRALDGDLTDTVEYVRAFNQFWDKDKLQVLLYIVFSLVVIIYLMIDKFFF